MMVFRIYCLKSTECTGSALCLHYSLGSFNCGHASKRWFVQYPVKAHLIVLLTASLSVNIAKTRRRLELRNISYATALY